MIERIKGLARRYYLSPIIGTGKDLDPFRPRVDENATAWGMIDLRADVTRPEGMAIVYVDSPGRSLDRQVTLLTDSLVEKSPALRQTLESNLGLTFTKSTLPEILAELLIGEQRPGLCKPIQPGCDGQYRIQLGGLIWGKPKPWYRRGTITEGFSGDGDALGADLSWTEYEDWDRVSGQASLQHTVGNDAARADSDLSSANHYAQVDVITLGQAGNQGGPAVRFSSSAETFYALWLYNGSGGQLYLSRSSGGTKTNISNVAHAYSLPDTLKLEIDGSGLTGYVNAAEEISNTDTNITGNVRCGVYGRAATASGTVLDNWEASELAAGAAFIPRVIMF